MSIETRDREQRELAKMHQALVRNLLESGRAVQVIHDEIIVDCSEADLLKALMATCPVGSFTVSELVDVRTWDDLKNR